MRRCSVLAAAALLAACASQPESAAWQGIQRDRLARLYAPRDAGEALAAVLRHDPHGAAQDPKHIDQREPRAAGDGLRAFHVPHLSVRAAVGYGRIDMHVAGTRLDDHTGARFARVAVDASSGAALEVNAYDSNDDLFAGVRINDGTVPARAEASLSGVDVFPHLRFETLRGELVMPLRVGAFVDWNHLAHVDAGVARDWLGIGPRLLLEPTWRLFGGQRSSLELAGRLGGDVGGTWFGERFHRGDDSDSTWRWSAEAGLGLRGQLGSWQGELGYRLQHTVFGDTDTSLLGDRERTELRRQQVFLGFGVEF